VDDLRARHPRFRQLSAEVRVLRSPLPDLLQQVRELLHDVPEFILDAGVVRGRQAHGGRVLGLVLVGDASAPHGELGLGIGDGDLLNFRHGVDEGDLPGAAVVEERERETFLRFLQIARAGSAGFEITAA